MDPSGVWSSLQPQTILWSYFSVAPTLGLRWRLNSGPPDGTVWGGESQGKVPEWASDQWEYWTRSHALYICCCIQVMIRIWSSITQPIPTKLIKGMKNRANWTRPTTIKPVHRKSHVTATDLVNCTALVVPIHKNIIEWKSGHGLGRTQCKVTKKCCQLKWKANLI